MARNRITGRETQKMQEMTSKFFEALTDQSGRA